MEVPQNGVVVWISDTTASLHLEELCELIDIFDAQRWDAVPHKLQTVNLFASLLL